MLSPKLLLVFIFISLIGLSVVGGIYYFQNSSKTSSGPLSSLNKTITQEPASLTLELGAPSEDGLVFEPNIVVSGRTAPQSQVLISSDTNDQVIESKKDGSFSTLFDLVEGVNNLKVVVFDKNGDERSTTRTVYYAKEKLQ